MNTVFSIFNFTFFFSVRIVTGCLPLFFSCTLLSQEASLVLPVGHTSSVVSAVYSNDLKYIVTASWDNTAKIWQAKDGRLLSELKGHSGSLNSAVFSRNGKWVVTASKDSTAKIWLASNGTIVSDLKGHTDWVSMAVFSPDGEYVVTASWDSTAKIWKTSNGQLIGELKAHSGPVSAASFSANGKYILTASGDSTAILWRVSDRHAVVRLKGHNGSITSACFSGDGKYIVTSSSDASARLWQMPDGHLLSELKGHSAAVNSAVFSPDGKYVVTASADKTGRIWSVPDGRFLAELKGHTAPVLSAVFSPDGRYVATASEDSTAVVWQSAKGNFVNRLTGHTGSVNSVVFGADGKYMVTASSDNTAKIWQVSDARMVSELRGHISVVKSAVYSPDGKYIVTSSWDNTAKMWHAANGQLLSELKAHSNWVNSVQFSPDGNYILTASSDNTAIIWHRYSGNFSMELKGHTDLLNTAIYSPDGSFILTTSWDSTARIWQAGDGKLIAVLKGHTDVVNFASFSADGKFIVTSSWDNTARIWQTKDGKLVTILKGHTDKVRSAVFSPDGKNVLTSSWDSTARIWDASNGSLLYDLKGHTASLNSAMYSPDGKNIVTASLDNTARIWLSADGQFLYELKGHRKAVISAIYSPDGKYIATASWDNTAGVWDASNGSLIASLAGHTGSLNSIAYSPDGKYLVTTSEDNTLKKWNALTGEFLYTFFAVDSNDYLAIDRYGHYDGTDAARKMLYYVCGNEIVDLEQFKDLAWEPGLVSKVMGVNKEPITARKISDINICNYTPSVTENGYNKLAYHYQITPKKGGIGEVQLYVNGKLVERYSPSSLAKKNNNYILTVNRKSIDDYFIPGEDNQVFVTATTKGGTMVSRGALVNAITDKKAAVSPNMYIISVGISEYKSDKLKLNYASKDGMDFSAAVAASARKLLNTNGKEHVFNYNFNTEPGSQRWPSKPLIEKLIDSISLKATAADIVVVFFAGHGVLQAGQKNFYLLTAEASSFEMNGVEKDVAISTEELKEWLRKIKANKQVLILDACNSGQVIQSIKQIMTGRDVPADQQRALESLKDKTGTFILSASASGQSAYETGLYGQGLLTYSLLFGIKLGGGLRDNRFIDITRWFNFASDNVKIMARDIGGRQDPQIIGNASFEVGIVDQEIMDSIKLSIRKKIFRNSKFIQDEELLNDDLDISGSMDRELNNLSERGKESPLVYVANNAMPDVYSVRGRYTVTGNSITAKISVFKGQKERVSQFDLAGTVDKKEEMVRRIVEKIQLFLKQ